MRASIIIPSYNSKERLKLNLLSLNCQDYQSDDVEIIVIDNGSKDNTMEMLKSTKLKYPHKFIRIEKNLGIANGRNKGITASKGDLLIFHDSDMIAAKNFITSHIKHHIYDNMVVCGNFWRRVYSYFYEDFSPKQITELKSKAGKRPCQIPYQNMLRLISDSEIENGKFLKYSFDLEIDFVKKLKSIAAKEGNDLSGYSIPWRFFITNNLSVERKIVLEAGMFDSNIIKYGYEDYDLGIRLYKSGSKFCLAPDILSVHQEHPQNFNHNDLLENLNYICNKYNNIYHIDVILTCLEGCLELSEDNINLLMKDIKMVLSLGGYDNILKLFLELLQVIRKMCFEQSFDNAVEMYKDIAKDMPALISQCHDLNSSHNAKYLVDELCSLLRRIFNIDLKMFI